MILQQMQLEQRRRERVAVVWILDLGQENVACTGFLGILRVQLRQYSQPQARAGA